MEDLAGELVLDEYRDQLAQAERLLRAGDTRTATEVLDALLAAKPEHGPALLLLGEARLDAGDFARAADAFERARRIRGNDPAALAGHGLALVGLGKYDDAIAILSRAIADAGGDRAILAMAYRGLGIAWRRTGDLDKAIRELRKAVTEDGTDVEARAALGEALVADGGPYEEAERHLARAAAAEPPPPLALYGLGRLALAQGAPAVASARLADARARIASAPELRGDLAAAQGDAALAEGDAMRAHGFYLEALGSNSAALRDAARSGDAGPFDRDRRSALLHGKVAAAHRSIGNLGAALDSYQRAIGLARPDQRLALLRAAVDTAIAARDAKFAVTWGADLLDLAPDDLRAVVARGIGIAAIQPDAARAMLELAAQQGDVDALVALSGLAPDPRTAAELALRALRLSPHHAAARTALTTARAAVFGEPSGEIHELASYVERIAESRRELGHLVGEVARAAANLDAPLLVTVMGEFSSGKSSFVNAFIGADVAPTGITPTTATINVVRYGRERGGRVVSVAGGSGGVSSAAGAAALELGWDALMAHLRALTPDAARAIDRVEILVPLPQLERINIVDTPGLNSIQPEHEATARAFIARADAVVWVFTANQGGKASERAALSSIRAEGKRVLGVLNKADQLSPEDLAEVVTFITGQLGELVETVVPVSARAALDWKRAGDAPALPDGNWPALGAALESRFFAQARQLKHDACARTLRHVVAEASASVAADLDRARSAGDAARKGRDDLAAASRAFAGETVLAERRTLSDETHALYRRAAREVLDLVRPRRLPFANHTATTADRDYLIALLSSGYDAALDAGRRRVSAALTAAARTAEPAARALGDEAAADLRRAADDRIGFALAQIFDRARAYLRGFLEGGYVEAFFRNDVPRLELAEDAVYHALVRGAPDLDREIGEPLTRAATDALAALVDRLAHWAAVADARAFDLDVGVGRALEAATARLAVGD
ncbi:MAG TPA: dynamin family protein [Kofleriaceae bacterium]